MHPDLPQWWASVLLTLVGAAMALGAAIWLAARSAQARADNTSSSQSLREQFDELPRPAGEGNSFGDDIFRELSGTQQEYLRRRFKAELRSEFTQPYVLGLAGIVVTAAGSVIPMFFPIP